MTPIIQWVSKIPVEIISILVAVFAVGLSVLTYRYALKVNLREPLAELESIKLDGTKIVPTLYSVSLLKRQSTLMFNTYELDGPEKRLSDTSEFFSDYIDTDGFESALPLRSKRSEEDIDPDTIFSVTDELERSLDLVVTRTWLDQEGFLIQTNSHSPNDLRKLADRILRRIIKHYSDEPSSE